MMTTAQDDMHAGELETSLLLHAEPSLVRSGYQSADHEASERPLLLTLGLQKYAPAGVIGRPSMATAEKGKLAIEALVKSFRPYLAALDVV